MVGNNEVLVIPSARLPPLDAIPRVQILDEANLNLVELKRFRDKASINSIRLLKKRPKEFMQGVN